MAATQPYLVFAFNHLTLIIEIIFAAILFLSIVWLVVNLKRESQGVHEMDENIREIEEALRRVLDSMGQRSTTPAQVAQLIKDDELKPRPKTATTAPTTTSPHAGVASVTPAAPPTTATPGVASVPASAVPAPSAVASVATSVPTPAAAANPSAPSTTPSTAAPSSPTTGISGGPSDPSPDTLVLQKKVDELTDSLKKRDLDASKLKDLESKLAEYEIIEDDLANLSLFKEENARLKNEIERLKQPGSAVVSPPKAAAPAAATAAGGEPMFPLKANPEGSEESGEKLIAEFEKFVKGGS